jgi:two-component system phosphate regulon sensor histidine kinase PhoR
LNHDKDFPDILADRDKIKQVLLNLISNAVKYNRQGGLIEVSAGFDSDNVSVSITDNGLGMQPDVVDHLFEKFYRAKSSEEQISGTGLGLSICKSIIESHNGGLSVSSTSGEGSCFTFRLPRRD